MQRPTIRRGSRSRRARTHAQRGVVFLFTSYLVSFTLLVLVTALFVRSANEVRLAERSTQLSQAFWGAEAALDKGVTDLQTKPPPYLALNGCTSSTSVSLVGTNTPQGNYRTCLDAEDTTTGISRYRILASGTKGYTSEALSAIVQYQVPTISFSHAAYATGGISLRNIVTGSMDSRISRLLARTAFHGDLATSATTVPAGRRGLVLLNQGSTVDGDVYVGPGADPAALVYVAPALVASMSIYSSGASQVTGALKNLSKATVLPPVEVPAYATNLGDRLSLVESSSVAHSLPGGGLNNYQGPTCLEPGTYVVGNLTMGDGGGKGELCTTGPVDLYVTGDLKVWGGDFYGQPTGTAPFQHQYAPENLRIFKQGGGYCFLVSGEGAATIYAPETNNVLLMGGMRFVGGLIAPSFDFQGIAGGYAGSSWYSRGYILYDEALRGKAIPVGPAKLTTLLWSRSASAAQSTAPAVAVKVLPPPSVGQPVTGGCSF